MNHLEKRWKRLEGGADDAAAAGKRLERDVVIEVCLVCPVYRGLADRLSSRSRSRPSRPFSRQISSQAKSRSALYPSARAKAKRYDCNLSL